MDQNFMGAMSYYSDTKGVSHQVSPPEGYHHDVYHSHHDVYHQDGSYIYQDRDDIRDDLMGAQAPVTVPESINTPDQYEAGPDAYLHPYNGYHPEAVSESDQSLHEGYHYHQLMMARLREEADVLLRSWNYSRPADLKARGIQVPGPRTCQVPPLSSTHVRVAAFSAPCRPPPPDALPHLGTPSQSTPGPATDCDRVRRPRFPVPGRTARLPLSLQPLEPSAPAARANPRGIRT